MEVEEIVTPRKVKKKFLKKYLKVKESVNRLEDKLLTIDTELKTLISTSHDYHELIEERTELNERINKLNRKALIYKRQVESVIDALINPLESQILEMIFIDGLDMYDISDKTSYSVRHVYRLYIDGLNHINLNVSID